MRLSLLTQHNRISSLTLNNRSRSAMERGSPVAERLVGRGCGVRPVHPCAQPTAPGPSLECSSRESMSFSRYTAAARDSVAHSCLSTSCISSRFRLDRTDRVLLLVTRSRPSTLPLHESLGTPGNLSASPSGHVARQASPTRLTGPPLSPRSAHRLRGASSAAAESAADLLSAHLPHLMLPRTRCTRSGWTRGWRVG